MSLTNTRDLYKIGSASAMSSNLVAVNINQPKFLQHENDQHFADIIEKLQDLALSHEVQLDIETHEGNEAKIEGTRQKRM